MATLTVTETYADGTAPTEAQLDSTRTSLTDFFNTTKMDGTNIAALSMLYTKLTDAPDDDPMTWGTGADATIEFVSANPSFDINVATASSKIVFTNKASTTETTSLTLQSSDTTIRIGTGGILKVNTAQGFTDYELMYLLSRYRKPRLEYTSDDIVTAENNTGVASETIILGRDRVWTCVDRSMSLAVTANGYAAAHTGAAVSGLEDGLTRAVNTWYFIYAVEVQFGDDNDGTKCILVASTTAPTQANAASNDTEFGAAKWVYMGCIRNGYNDGVSTNIIVPFIYDGFGHMDFISSTADTGAGVRLVDDATDTDSTYTVALGTGATNIPVTAFQARFLFYRADAGLSAQYEDASAVDLYISGSKSDSPNPAMADMIVPVTSGYVARLVRCDAGAHQKNIYLAGITDHYL